METRLVDLRQSLEELVGESRALRVDIGSFERSRQRGTIINIVFTAMAVCAVTLVGIIGYQNNELSHTIRSCTTPGQKCYQDARKSTGDSVRQIVQSAVFAAECQRSTKTDRELEDCVAAKARESTTVKP